MNHIDTTFDKIVSGVNKEEMDKEYLTALTDQIITSERFRAATVKVIADVITTGCLTQFLEDITRLLALAYISGRLSITADLEKEIK